MGLITENNLQYYGGTQIFQASAGVNSFTTTFNTDLVYYTNDPTALQWPLNNFQVQLSIDGGITYVAYEAPAYSYEVDRNTITTGVLNDGDVIQVQLTESTTWNNYGGYAYTKLNDIINNYLIAYVGAGKLIPSVKRTDVIFHAKRGLQEFSFDTLKSIKSVELQVPPSLSLIIPQDYVNYVRISYVDQLGVQHTIQPARTLTTSPYQNLIQDSLGEPVQDANFNNTEGTSLTEQAWSVANNRLISGWNGNIWSFYTDYFQGGYPLYWNAFVGQRYGLDPQFSQTNGWFNINEREGKFSFSSDMSGRLVIIEYISDGLAYDLDTKVPKMAEDAMYAHINHSILAGRVNISEYIVRRYQKERSAKLRNAKIRLSNIKLDEIVQVMRGKSKWIKH